MFTRRLFIAGAASTALGAPAIVRARSLWRAFPFSLGVASGDPAPDGFVIWTKLAPEPLAPHGGMALAAADVSWEVAEDSGFRTIAASGTAIARPELGHAVHVEVSGLQPDRPYFYRFTADGEQSLRGRARTLPAAGSAPAAVKFGVAGCNNYEDGFFGAFRHLAAEQDLAFVYHYGDFIYEYRQDYEFVGGLPTAPVRQHAFRNLIDVGDYRLAYAQTLSDIDLHAARASHAFLSSFDDHEINNNWVSDVDNWTLTNGADPAAPSAEIFAFRKAAAFQAWYEHMPVRRAQMPRGPSVAMNRELRYGNLLSMQLLDTRQFRSDQPCGDGFKPACPEVTAADRQVLGREQEAWLGRNIANRAQWYALAQQIMMMSLDRRRRAEETERVLNLDSWAGYEAARQRMLGRIAGLGNTVVLTGDEHQNVAGDLVQRDRVVGSEFVATSISSGGDGSDLRQGSDVFRTNNPEVKFLNDQRGYLVCDVNREAWRTQFRVVDRVTTAINALSTRAVAEIAHGTPGVRMTT
jgi:alkaline phosphatase D